MSGNVGSYLDRLCAAGAGVMGYASVLAFTDGDGVRGFSGLVAAGFLAWLSTSDTQPLRRDPHQVSAADRERLLGTLRDVYGDDVDRVPLAPSFGIHQGAIGDIFGTPVYWCREARTHKAHLWPVNGPGYAPALCMGHECEHPETHVR